MAHVLSRANGCAGISWRWVQPKASPAYTYRWSRYDNEIKAIVAEAVQFAQESPEPDPSELYTDVYVEA